MVRTSRKFAASTSSRRSCSLCVRSSTINNAEAGWAAFCLWKGTIVTLKTVPVSGSNLNVGMPEPVFNT